MRYHYLYGATPTRKKGKKLFIAVPVFGVLAGMYMLVNTLAPEMQMLENKPKDATAQKLVTVKPGNDGNRLFIPQINVDVAVVEGNTEAALELGAWHRDKNNGSPVTGGNFVLSAHRFLLGATPIQTRAKSPFYHLDKLQVGDEVFVDYDGKRYVYEVNRKYKVPESATEIEAPSEDDKLTLYSCDLRGPAAGREVIEAKPAGIVAWNDGKNPRIDRSKMQ